MNPQYNKKCIFLQNVPLRSNYFKHILTVSALTTIETDRVNNFAGCNVELDGVIDLDDGIRITNGSAVVRYQEWNSLGTNLTTSDLAELVLKYTSFFSNLHKKLNF